MTPDCSLSYRVQSESVKLLVTKAKKYYKSPQLNQPIYLNYVRLIESASKT